MSRVLPAFHAPKNVGLTTRKPYFNMIFQSASAVCDITDGASAINEISGMHALHKSANYGNFVVIDDDISNKVFFIDRDGDTQGEVTLTGLTWADGECVTGYTDPSDDVSYLIIGEIGDNNSVRSPKKLHRFVEPTVTGSNIAIAAVDYETIECVFPATPTFTSTPGAGGILGDTEALFVDPIDDLIYIFTKREPRPRIYTLPLQDSYTGTQTFTYRGEVHESFVTLENTGPSQVSGGTYTGMTEACISRNGQFVLAKTYTDVYQFWREDTSIPWYTVMQEQTPIVDPNYVGLGTGPAQEPQGEAMTFDAEDKGYYTTSENGAGAVLPIYYYSRK